MQPFDFNVHPNFKEPKHFQNVNDIVFTEMNCSMDNIVETLSYDINCGSWSKKISGFNLMVFSNLLTVHPDQSSLLVDRVSQLCKANSLLISYTFLIDPRFHNISKKLMSSWKQAGAKYIKFHSYHHRIDDELINTCVDISIKAQEIGLGICVDASYGTIGLFDFDNLKLVVKILSMVKETPVVILHCGGLRAYEAALIVDDVDNAYIELSFSPHFYRNTSIYSRFVDILSMVDSKRILYASDYPYISHDDALSTCRSLLEDASLSSEIKNNILYKNSLSLINN